MLKKQKSSPINKDALDLSQSSQEVLATKSHAEAMPATDLDSYEISDILSKRYRGISVYGAFMLLLAAAIIWTAVITAKQVQQYHQDYMALQKLKSDYRKLKIENQRLIIEQQTFSATPQIASRAVTELGMYSPAMSDKLILQPMVRQTGVGQAISDTISQVYNPSTALQEMGGSDE